MPLTKGTSIYLYFFFQTHTENLDISRHNSIIDFIDFALDHGTGRGGEPSLTD